MTDEEIKTLKAFSCRIDRTCADVLLFRGLTQYEPPEEAQKAEANLVELAKHLREFLNNLPDTM